MRKKQQQANIEKKMRQVEVMIDQALSCISKSLRRMTTKLKLTARVKKTMKMMMNYGIERKSGRQLQKNLLLQ